MSLNNAHSLLDILMSHVLRKYSAEDHVIRGIQDTALDDERDIDSSDDDGEDFLHINVTAIVHSRVYPYL